MSESSPAWKVGAFVFVALVLLALALLTFSKGLGWLTPAYTLRLRADSVGGLKTKSAVLVSGVPVGRVVGTELAPDGKGVTVFLKINKRYGLHRDAEFVVEQIGLLGDQYVVVHPTRNQAPLLQDGDEVIGRPPFSFQTLAVSTVGFIERVDETTRLLKEAVTRINNTFLTEQTLTNLAQSAGNIRAVSERAIVLVDNLNTVVFTNAPSFTASLTNFERFSGDLTLLAAELRDTVGENRTNFTSMIRNFEESSRAMGATAREFEQGRGLAGGLFKDEQLRATLSNTLANLATVSSNIARYGLLYKPKPAKAEPAAKAARSPRDAAR